MAPRHEVPTNPILRRRHERFAIDPPLGGLVESVGPVSIVDISVRGARIRHENPLPAGAPVRLRFRPSPRSLALTLRAIVVWSRPIEPGVSADAQRVQTGLQFDDSVDALGTVIQHLFGKGAIIKLSEREADS